jgi:hypothetical protein
MASVQEGRNLDPQVFPEIIIPANGTATFTVDVPTQGALVDAYGILQNWPPAYELIVSPQRNPRP